jgi:hypothetical protein
MFRRFTRSIAAVASVATIGLFAIPEVAHAAALTVTVTSGSENVPGAFVALVNTTTGAAIDGAITGSDGKASLDSGSAALGTTKVIVSKPGFDSATTTTVAAATAVSLTAKTNSALQFTNVYGAQVRNLAADGESGVFYATTDNKPSVWRTTDYAGNWAPVPTTADATTGLPQDQAMIVVTSSYPGEVAVGLQQSGIWFSRDYGTTWVKVKGSQSNPGALLWAHAGTSSYLFAKEGATWKAAIMSATEPELANFTAPTGMDAAGKWAIAAGSQASNKVFIASLQTDGSGVNLAELAIGAANVAAITGNAVIVPVTASSTNGGRAQTGDLFMISTQNSASIKAIVVYDREQSAQTTEATLKVAFWNGSAWSIGTGALAGTIAGAQLNGSQNNAWTTSWTRIGEAAMDPNNPPTKQSMCGENETGPVGSIANMVPENFFSDFAVIGTIRQCFFAFNATGTSKNYAGQAGASVPSLSTAIMPMMGANNNTGFVFDAGFNLNDNFIGLSGDGGFGLRKTSNIAGPAWRPSFGQAGTASADQFIGSLADPGTGLTSDGVAVNGMVGAVIKDTAFSPNITDGSTFIVSTSATGGSRTVLTNDGGKSFSTIGAGGSNQIDWWNGASGKQWIAAGYPLNSKNFFRVKNFSSATGAGKTQMGEELAATTTAAQRDSATDNSLRFAFEDIVPTPAGASCFGTQDFIYENNVNCTQGQSSNDVELSAMAGVPGYDKMIVGISKGTPSDGGGSSTTSGTVGVITFTPNTNNDSGASIASVVYLGAELSNPQGTTTGATGQFGASKSSTYTGRVMSIAYCPKGSAADVADKAFVAVAGKGMYVISNVSETPSHAASGTTSGTFNDLSIDCDTGIIVGATSTGPQMSLDGSTFKALTLPTSVNVQNAKSVDVQADLTSGGVSVVVGTNDSTVVAADTTLTSLGTTAAKLTAGEAATPTTINIGAENTAKMNDKTDGRDTGTISDIEFPAEASDKVTAAAFVGPRITKFATVRSIAVGTGSGAFRARTTAAVGGTTPQTPVGQTPAAQTPAAQTPTAPVVQQPTQQQPTVGTPVAAAPKVVTVGVKKTTTVASALRTLGIAVVAKSKVVTATTTKTVCSVLPGNKVKGLKAGVCRLTVKITPPKTKKVPKPKTTTKRITVTIK